MRRLAFLVVIGFVAGRVSVHRRKQERRAAQAIFATACGSVGYSFAAHLTETYQPGGMAYYRIRKPLLTPSQQIATGLFSVGLGFCLSGRVVCRDDMLGRSLLHSGRYMLRVTDELRGRWQDREKRRRQAERREWMQTHTKPARVHRR